MSEINNQTTTTTTYEYRSTSPNTNQNVNYDYGNTQANNYEYSRTVGNPGVSYEHTVTTNNPGSNYLAPSGNSRGPGDFGSTNYEYSRTVGSPGQTYEYSSQNWDRDRKSAGPGVNYDVTVERRVLHHDNDPIMTRSYIQDRPVRSTPPANKAPRKKSSEDEQEGPNYDFNQKNDLVDLMAEEHRQLRGTLPIVTTNLTTKDLLLSDYRPASDVPRKTADEILKEFPITTHTQVEVAKKSAPIHVIASTSEPTAAHHLEEWSKRKYLVDMIDRDDEVEETRLDYCGLCVSKRKGRRPKY